jgi:hypothetical protein
MLGKGSKICAAVDLLFTENPRSIDAYYEPIRNYLIGTRGCNVDEVISISKTSKYFSELGEMYTEYCNRSEKQEGRCKLWAEKGHRKYRSPRCHV